MNTDPIIILWYILQGGAGLFNILKVIYDYRQRGIEIESLKAKIIELEKQRNEPANRTA